MNGYNPKFLGINIPFPEFSPSLVSSVLKKDALDQEIYVNYYNYTTVINRELRTPIFNAFNIDQSKLFNVKRKKNWDIDSRVGNENQLNNDYYFANPWDRGHLARRAAVAWGENKREAQKASDNTFFYTNATLQHENFNQDEWLALEDWVLNLEEDSSNKISVFAGPIFGDFSRSITPPGRETALIPSAFFKIICFINKSKELEVRAFIMYQDEEALKDKNGKKVFNYQRYQVTVTEIEELTGLIFPDEIANKNPLFFNENEEAKTSLGVTDLPERIEVDSPQEIIATGQERTKVLDDKVPVYIAAALVNPSGDETKFEWVSIINLSNKKIDLKGWKLKDPEASLELKGEINPGEAIRFSPLLPIQLGNRGGTISLFNDKGERIDRVKYPQQTNETEDVPVIFAMRDKVHVQVENVK
jgi:endonuclease G